MSRHRNMEDDDDVDEFLYGAPEDTKGAEQQNDSTMKESNPTEDDDLYQLYRGSTANETQEVGTSRQDMDMDESQSGSNEQARPMEEEEEEDSDDDLEIILEPEEDSTAQPSKETGAANEEKGSLVNIKPGQQNKIPGNANGSGTPNLSSASGGNAASASAQAAAKGSVGTSGINLEAVGEYNGVPITEVDLDGLDDKPWRKPGADITDYFNYGFNEVTWRAYCAQQKMIRESRKMMGDMDMSEFMPMGMMMPPGMMDNNNGGMPMGMPNMMGMPGMPPMPGAPNPAMAAAAAAAMSSPAAAGSSPAVMGGNRNMMRPAGRQGGRSSGRPDGGNERDGGNEGGMGGSFFWPPQMQPPFFS